MKNWKLIFISIIILLFLLLLLFYSFNKINNIYYPSVQEKLATINNYYIYGHFFNIEGLLDKKVDKTQIKDVTIILHSEYLDIYWDAIYQINEENIYFKISREINSGINLDHIAVGRYFLILKLYYIDNRVEYYSFMNNTRYGDLDYYTITNNDKNNYITIEFNSINNQSFLELNVTETNLPHYVYDIVIDPGHGGIDSGAVVNNIHESLIVLDIAIKLKEELEKMGLKIKLTRTGNYNPGGDGVDPYYEIGRVNIPNNARAKYFFSIHLNSAPYKMKKGGVEIYSPPNSNLILPKLMASNIVKYAKTRYSPNNLNKKSDGVYVRTYNEEEIKKDILEAKKNNYMPYKITTNTPYHYIIRETGGIVTGAYIDGRNKKYHKNIYYDSNIGVESYLIELGFMVNSFDINNMIHNQNGYVLGIIEGVKAFLNQ